MYIAVLMRPITLHTRPKEMFLNRLEIESVAVKNAVKLDGNHLLVVYKQEGGHIERRVVDGPTVFIPSAHEWYVASLLPSLSLSLSTHTQYLPPPPLPLTFPLSLPPSLPSTLLPPSLSLQAS